MSRTHNGARQPQEPTLSAELYRNFSEQLDMPPESDLDLDVRYEILLSKVVYLRNLMTQCFSAVNRQLDGAQLVFTPQDFVNIQNSFLVTRDLIRECLLTSVRVAVDQQALLHKPADEGT
jgi:hypothetical protein